LLRQTGIPLQEVGGLAVSEGPGSFTGLRIGMATAKGLAQGRGIPLVGVPTLLALAHRGYGSQELVCPVMNARRNEIYTALFRFEQDSYETLEPYQAVDPRKWAEKLKGLAKPVLFVGDGVEIYAETWQEHLGPRALLALPVLRLAVAGTVAWLGRGMLIKGVRDDLYSLKPMYIRPAEAQAKLQAGICKG
jgi:tRNA threonylcarbamoyladenosine biosynthesis protein TsaB